MQNPNPSKLLSPSHDVNGLTDRPGHGEAAMAASILGRVAAHLRDRPDAIAIVDGTTRLDWRALGRQVARITARLRDAGVTPGARVALALPRSADFVASVLAVWRLRACYVPFDPAMPPVRLQYQASDSGARACITRGAQRPDWLPDNMVVVAAGIDDTGPSDRYAAGSGVADGLDGTVDRVDDSHILAPWPAYVIYTSGSTGRPKGVSISHRALHAYLDGVATRLPASSIGSAAWISTPAADLGHTVLFGALWHGWTLHVVSADLAADADEFAAYMRAARIDLIKIVPGHLNGLLQAANPADVLPRQCVVLGGEPCAWQLVARILALRPACRVINHYGPTESTVGVLTHEVDPALVTHAIDDAAGPDAGLSMESMQQTRADRSALSTKTFPGVTVPLGRPLPGVVACLIGDDGTLLDGEQTGELCIGGASVADGYLHQPSLSAARFVPGSLIQGEAANETSRARDAMQAQADGLRLYRTGDRVRRLADGAFLFLGRIDDQVKVRGYRVELEEVAAQLRGLHHVRDAVVIARADGDAPPQLHGYLAGPADLDIDAMRALLASRLPDYMVPSTLQVLPVLPVTPNGKIDRAALPDPKPLPRAMAQVHGAVARENSPTAGGPSGQTSVAAMQKVDTNQNDPASTLLAIWRQVLRRDDIDMEDNFFEIGGDSILSLQIIAKWRRVGWKLTPKQMFAHPTVAGAAQVAQRIDTPTGAAGTATSATTTTVVSGNNVNVTPHAPAPQESAPADATVTGHRVGAPQPAKHATPATSMRYPATPMQQGLLFHAMRDAAQGVYLGQLRLTLDGVAADLMREAWQCVLDRHPVLRTAFDWPSDSDAWQVVASDVAVPWTVHDYRERTDYEAHYVAARDADLARGIDTRHAPLFRVALFQRPDGAADLLWTHHHVLTDGWSTAQLIAEVLEAYQAKVAGNSLDYVPAASSYADYVAWRGAQPDGHAFWQARLAARDAPAMVADIAALPLGRSIKPADVSEASVCHDINTVRHQRIMHAASRAQVTLSTLLQAAWALVLTQYAGRTQAVFGVTLSGRPEALPESDRTIGLFINTLPVWIDVERTRPLIQWLRDLQSASVSLHEVAHTPLQHLQQWAGAPTAPLFDSTLVVENYPLDARLRGDAARVPDGPRVRAIEARDRTHLPLTIVVAPAHLIGNDGVTDRAGPGAALRVSWRWQPQTCDGTVIRRMAGAFDGMLDQLVASVIERAGQDASSRKVCVRDVLASATATQRALSPVAASGSLSDCLPSTSTPVAFLSVMSRIAAQAVARAECVAITAFSASSDGPGRGNALDVATRGIEAMQDNHGKQAASRETTDLDYAALMHVSARIARRCLMALVQSKAGTEPRIGVALPRDIHLVPSLLGVLRAGAVYVPLDPENPDARLAYIGRDAALDALIVDPALVERFSALLPDVPRIVVDVTFKSPGDSSADVQAIDGDDAMSIDAPVHPAQLAYVIYTSGSTGEPKGVGVTHGNVSSLFEATSGGFAFDENDVWTLFHSYAFDFSVWEIFGALVHGGRLVVVPHWTAREPSALHALLRGQGVTVLNQTPSAFAQLTREDRENTLDSLRVVIFGGERLDAGSIVEWAQRASARGVRPLLVNMYGITETTVHVTWRVLDDALLRASARSGRSVIGEALPGWEARLCDAEGNGVPEGGQGEILVGGAGVTRGYIGRPSLTALRYVPNEAGAPGSRAYRSGDLGRAQRFEAGEPGGGADARSAGGEMGSSESAGLLLCYVGRNDDQVKIRGYRIELGEIQAALQAHPSVREAAIIVSEGRISADGTPPGSAEDGAATRETRLLAYWIPVDGCDSGVDAAALRQSLRERLPVHMVPSAFVKLDRFPLTTNGKLDRRALPQPGEERAKAHVNERANPHSQQTQSTMIQSDNIDTYRAPRDPIEAAIAHIWQTQLQVSRVGVDDDFFALGGHSLLAVRMLTAVRETFGKAPPLRSVFDRPTLAAFTVVVRAAMFGQPLPDVSEDGDKPVNHGDDTRASSMVSNKETMEDTTPAAADGDDIWQASAADPFALDDEDGKAMPLSPSQTQLWFLWRLDPQASAYNINGAIQLTGTLDTTALAQALAQLPLHHPALRMRFSMQGGEHGGVPVQYVDADARLTLSKVDMSDTAHVGESVSPTSHDVSASASASVPARVQTYLRECARKPFDLLAEPPVRATLICTAPDAHLLHLSMHHIIGDDWSVGLLMRDLARIYRHLAGVAEARHGQGQPSATAVTRAAAKVAIAAYRDHIQHRLDVAEHDEAQLAYWRDALTSAYEAADGVHSLDAPMALPYDRQHHARAADTAGRPGGRLQRRVPPDAVRAVRRLAQRCGVTPFVAMLAAVDLLLYRYTGQRDLRIGVPLAGRDAEKAADIVGFFVNTVALRARMRANMTLRGLLAQVKDRVLDAHAHQALPFAKVVRALCPARDLTCTPLFQVLVNQQQRFAEDTAFGEGLRACVSPIDSGEAQFDLMVQFGDMHSVPGGASNGPDTRTLMPDVTAPNAVKHIADGEVSIDWTFARDVFDEATVAAMADALVGLLTQWARADANHGMPEDLPLAHWQLGGGADERLTSLAMTSARASDGASGNRHHLENNDDFVARIVAQMMTRPDALAVTLPADGTHAQSDWRYRDLALASAAIARALRARGVTVETRVGVAMQRGAALIATLLGVLRAGGVYVPLDPAYPASRIAYIAADAGLHCVLTDQASADVFIGSGGVVPREQLLDIDALLAEGTSGAVQERIDAPVHPAQLAYVIYTSGSTGEPKGVGVTHGNVSSLFEATSGGFAFDENDVWTLFHSYAFDFSVWEIFGALVHGGRLVVVPHWTAREPSALHALLRGQGVTVLNQTPSAFAQLTREDRENTLDSLRVVIFGGERLDAGSIVEWAQRASARGVRPLLVNMYGITETTVHVTWRVLDDALLRASARSGRSVIGEALPGWEARLCDAEGNGVPEGGQGEILVGGAGVTRGYIGRPSLTALRYVPNEAGAPGSRAYRSGDLGRAQRFEAGELGGGADARSARGEMGSSESAGLLLCYVGRNDDQVKIRGYRIELGEIQAALQAHPSVREAAIIVSEGRISADGTPPGSAKDGAAKQGSDAARERAHAPAGALQAHPARLIAYVVPRDGNTGTRGGDNDGTHVPRYDREALHGWLSERLPAHMVPSAFVIIDQFPLTANGKLDRRALPLPEIVTDAKGQGKTADADESQRGAQAAGLDVEVGPAEAVLTAVWRKVLGQVKIDRHDNFFVVGGDSILSLQIVAQAREAGWVITPRQLFEAPTIAALSARAQPINAAIVTRSTESDDVARHSESADVHAGKPDTALSVTASANVAADENADAAGAVHRTWRALGLVPEHVDDVYPASPLQSGLLFHSVAGGENAAYLNQFHLTLRGRFDAEVFHAAWAAAMIRHPMLRTRFLWQHGGAPMQVVQRHGPLPYVVHDWRGRDHADVATALAAWRARDLEKGMALDAVPLMRIAVFEQDGGVTDIVWTHHHVLLDGWSMATLFGEVLRDYQARLDGVACTFASVPGYRTYLTRVNRVSDDPATREWWERHALGGLHRENHDVGASNIAATGEDALPATLIPSVPAPQARVPGVATSREQLPPGLSDGLTQAARDYRVTLNTIMQGAWAIVLARYGHRTRVAYGTTLSGRPSDLPGADRMVGLFINTLPVLFDVAPSAPLGDWLGALQQHLSAMGDMASTPLARVQQWLGRSGDALFDSLLVFENYPLDATVSDARGGQAGRDANSDGPLAITHVDAVDATHYPLALAVMPRRGRIALEWSWDGARLDRDTVMQLATDYRTVLMRLAHSTLAGATRPVVADINLLPLNEAGDRAVLPSTKGGASSSYREPHCYPYESVVSALRAQALRTPEAVAVRCEGGNGAGFGRRADGGVPQETSLTYGALEAWSGRIALRLRAAGVCAETRVGLCVGRGPALIAGMLGIWRAGGAFVPLDPSYPLERLVMMREDAGIAQVVGDEASVRGVASLFDEVTLIDVGSACEGEEVMEAPVAALHPSQLAYVLYTSGSTGRPKGVAVEHEALWVHLQDFLSTYEITAEDVVLHSSTINFDVALHEIVPALLRGARIEMRGEQPWDLRSLSARLVGGGVTFARIPTALWQQWQHHAPARELLKLRQVTVGGEALPGDALAVWQGGALGDIALDNLYGPTETTVAALYRRTQASDASATTVPIGIAYPGRTARVLDAFGDIAPVGGLGELCIGGPTVARGYLGRASQTAERFVPDPYGAPGARQYRSGDLCRMQADGCVGFLGRLDQQVKLRGQRIELGEIEAALRSCEGVREAAVIVTGTGAQQRLAAYVAGEGEGESQGVVEGQVRAGLDGGVIREVLQRKLPSYMVPTSVMVLEKLPSMPNGKLDRGALPLVQEGVFGGERTQARNDEEQTLLGIWRAVLGREDVGVTENFFEAGGDSIQSLQIIARAREAGWVLTPTQIFEQPTVAQQVTCWTAVHATAPAANTGGTNEDATLPRGVAHDPRGQHPRQSSLQSLNDDLSPFPLTPIQQRFFLRYPHGEAHWNQSVLLRVKGVLDISALARAVEALRLRHDALRLRFTRSDADGWRQWVAPRAIREDDLIRRQTLRDWDDLAAAGERVQASLDLQRGPIWRIGYFDVAGNAADAVPVAAVPETRLLLAIHHLAVDGVSWRVLLDELQQAYEQAERDEPVVLPEPSTPWREWVGALYHHACADDVQREAAWWASHQGAHAAPSGDTAGNVRAHDLFTAGKGLPCLMRDSVVREWRLDATRTRALLQQVPRAYRTRPDELLLAALVQAIGQWAHVAEVPIELEGHGREDLIDGVDLSRTVGWFTTRFPLVFKVSPAADEQAANAGANVDDDPDAGATSLIAVKETLRAVPNKGFHWGLLQMVNECGTPASGASASVQSPPPISFNYLGRFDQTLSDDARFAFSGDAAGKSTSEHAFLEHALDLNAMVSGDELQVRWRHDPARISVEALDQIVAAFARQVDDLIDHCLRARSGATASDFPLSGLDQNGWRAVRRQLSQPVGVGGSARKVVDISKIADIYPATPLQQGMLYHSTLQQGAGVYINQVQLTLGGAVDVAAMHQAWRSVVARHDMLRTQFEWGHGGDALQIVLREATLPFEVHDWRDRPDYDAALRNWRTRDLAAGVDVTRAPLMRVHLFRRPDGRHDLVRTHHHVLTDGWSGAQLLNDVFDAYQTHLRRSSARQGGQPETPLPRVAPAPSYRGYVRWLSGQPTARDWWLARLAEVDDPGTLCNSLAARRVGAVAHASINASKRASNEVVAGMASDKLVMHLDSTLDAALRRAAQRAHVTLNTVMQGAWAVLLSRLSGKRGVAFGVTVSGRPATLPDADRMIGLFINSLPVLIDAPGDMPLRDWLQRLQRYNLQMRDVAHTPLTELQQWAGRSGDALFDSLVVFENYPVSRRQVPSAAAGERLGVDADKSALAALRIDAVDAVERTHYPLTLTIVPSRIDTADDRPGQPVALGDPRDDSEKRGAIVHWSWQTARLDSVQIRQLHAQYVTLLIQLAGLGAEPVTDDRDAPDGDVFDSDMGAMTPGEASGVAPGAVTVAAHRRAVRYVGDLSVEPSSNAADAPASDVVTQARSPASAWSAASPSIVADTLGGGVEGAVSVVARVEALAVQMPSRVAVRSLTRIGTENGMQAGYDGVNAYGDALDYAGLARWLRRLHGDLARHRLPPEGAVAVCMRRTPGLIASMLAIWRAGGVYLPMDPLLPPARLAAMLDEAGVAHVIVDETGRAALDGLLAHRAVIDVAPCPDRIPQAEEVTQDSAPCDAQQLAYVIFTSGSTGRPKGVAVPHGALDRLLRSVDAAIGQRDDDLFVSATTASFDISLTEFCLPLLRGATVGLVDDAVLGDGAALGAIIDASGATIMQATPSGWRLLLEAGWRRHALGEGAGNGGRLLGLSAGEPLPADVAAALRQRGVTMWNLYGPTETTIYSSGMLVAAAMTSATLPPVAPFGDDGSWQRDTRPAQDATVAIGPALPGNTVRLCDASGQATASGGVGELCIGGDNLARGYLGRPGLTAERFVPDPFGAPGARMYRSGDLGRVEESETVAGDIVQGFACLGRIDQQIKLRGYRIELEEIETALRDIPGVRDAAVVVVNGIAVAAHTQGMMGTSDAVAADADAQARLVALLIREGDASANADVDVDWRTPLMARLPRYMIPSAACRVTFLPRTPNGKLDRKVLLQLARDGIAAQKQRTDAADTGDVMPMTGMTALIAETIGAVLGVTRVGADDDFFALGGHSLAAVRVCARLTQLCGTQVALTMLFSHPTPARLAAYLDGPHGGDSGLPAAVHRTPVDARSAPNVASDGGRPAPDTSLQAFDDLFDALD